MARALIKVPPSARRGEVIEIRTLIAHPMETGYRAGRGRAGRCRATSCGDSRAATTASSSFGAELHPAVAANPYFAFSAIAAESGTLTFTWEGRQRLRADGDCRDRGDMTRAATVLVVACVALAGAADGAADAPAHGLRRP